MHIYIACWIDAGSARSMLFVTQLNHGERSAKHILFFIFKQIVDFKKSNYGKSEIVDVNNNNGLSDNFDMDCNGNGMNRYNNVKLNDDLQQPMQLNPNKLIDLAPMTLTNKLPEVTNFQFGGKKLGDTKLSDNDFHK